MTNLLIKLFVKDNENPKDENVRPKYAMLSSITGIVVNLLLSIFKLVIGIVTNSMSIISDALNNVTDTGSSIVTMIGFKLSQKEVDNEHPWGHGRMEYITAFIVDILIILVGVELLQNSVDKIIHPVMPTVNGVVIFLLVVAILVKLWLFVFYSKIAKRIDSSAIKATAYDSISDCVSTFVVLFSSVISLIFGITIDGYVSILVAIFILITGVKALKETIDILLGSKPDKEFIDQISEFVKKSVSKKYPMIAGIHDIMVHDYGPGRKIVSFHAEVPADANICEAHDIIDELEQDMLKEFKCITTIHMDPIVVNDAKINEAKASVEKIVKEINENYSIHDFRMTDGGKRINLIFDLVIPRDDKIDKDALRKEIIEKVKKIDSKYYVVFTIEHLFV